MKKVVEEFVTDTDYVWIHDYHLLVLPSLLRKSFNKIRWGGGGLAVCRRIMCAQGEGGQPGNRVMQSVFCWGVGA